MYHNLQNCRLFFGLESEVIEILLASITYQVKKYKKGDLIAQSGEEIINHKLLIEGSVKGEMIDFAGKTIKIEDIESPRSLAPAFLFGSDNKYPVDIVANKDVLLISIPKLEFLSLMGQSETILHNYLDIISDRTQFLSAKLKFLSFQSIKGKLANYLLTLSKQQKNSTVDIPITQNDLSELFAVTRPSLSRALREMNDDGLIEARGKSIRLIDKVALSALLR